MKIVADTIAITELAEMATHFFGNLVKAVVDIERGLLAVDAGLHADLETLLLDDGSKQLDLWGINLYPELSGEEMIEFDSMINIRPQLGNRSRTVEDPRVQEKIAEIISRMVIP